ncbi:unnamed protein product, partial [Linum tenue]
ITIPILEPPLPIPDDDKVSAVNASSSSPTTAAAGDSAISTSPLPHSSNSTHDYYNYRSTPPAEVESPKIITIVAGRSPRPEYNNRRRYGAFLRDRVFPLASSSAN